MQNLEGETLRLQGTFNTTVPPSHILKQGEKRVDLSGCCS